MYQLTNSLLIIAIVSQPKSSNCQLQFVGIFLEFHLSQEISRNFRTIDVTNSIHIIMGGKTIDVYM